ncbi:MAG: glutamine--tRNA ligase, partial [Desulfobacterota bacterium]|nr:glutamine--tRNA ligase [Thermodesulfobacteriota bacterium]
PNKTDEGKDFKSNLNPDSVEASKECYVEPSLKDAKPGLAYQFERKGYFCLDPKDSSAIQILFD